MKSFKSCFPFCEESLTDACNITNRTVRKILVDTASPGAVLCFSGESLPSKFLWIITSLIYKWFPISISLFNSFMYTFNLRHFSTMTVIRTPLFYRIVLGPTLGQSPHSAGLPSTSTSHYVGDTFTWARAPAPPSSTRLEGEKDGKWEDIHGG